jgi:hypothetical protein
MRALALTLLAACGQAPAEYTYCNGSRGDAYFIYERYQLAAGDILATCEVSGPSASISRTTIYRKDAKAAELAACVLTYDFDDPSGGTWLLSRAAAVYSDSGSPLDGARVPLACD